MCFNRGGIASFFCCGRAFGPCAAAGAGKCGTCHSSKLQCAWPNVDDACMNSVRPQDCGLTLPRLGCETVIGVQSRCTFKSVNVSIADCGPNTKNFCGSMRCCGFQCAMERIIDLTPAAFSAIDSLDRGLIPVGLNR